MIRSALDDFRFRIGNVDGFAVTVRIVLRASRLLFVADRHYNDLIGNHRHLIAIFRRLHRGVRQRFTRVQLFLPFLLRVFCRLLALQPTALVGSQVGNVFVEVRRLARGRPRRRDLPIPFHSTRATRRLQDGLSALLMYLRGVSNFNEDHAVGVTRLLIPVFRFK